MSAQLCFGSNIGSFSSLLCCKFIGLIALTLIDFDTQFLPDDLTYPLLWLGLLLSTPHGDPSYYTSRGSIAVARPTAGSAEATVDLDGFFGLHPAMSPRPASPANQATFRPPHRPQR